MKKFTLTKNSLSGPRWGSDSGGTWPLRLPRVLHRVTLLLAMLLGFSGYVVGQSTTYNYTGATQTFAVTAPMTSVTVQAWGGGGAGGGSTNAGTGVARGGSGGGSGAYVSYTYTGLAVGNYDVVVGNRGVPGVSPSAATPATASLFYLAATPGWANRISAAFGAGGVASTSGTPAPIGGAAGSACVAPGGATIVAGLAGGNGSTGYGITSGPGRAGASGGGAGGAGVGTVGNTAPGNPGLVAGGSGSGARTSQNNGARDGGNGGYGRIIVSWTVGTGPYISTVTSALSPLDIACLGSTITITGNNFTPVPTTVTIGGIPCTIVTISATVITVTCSTNVSGSLIVTNSLGTATYANVYTVGMPTGTVALATDNPICVGSTLDLTGYAVGATSWAWSRDQLDFSSTDRNTEVPNFQPSNAGLYYLQASNACGPAATVNTGDVSVNPIPTVTVAAAAADVCLTAGANTTTLSYSAPTESPINYNISWSATPTNSFVEVIAAALPGTVGTTPVTINIPAGTAAGTYTGYFSVVNANGCESISSTFTLTVQPLPTISGFTVAPLCYSAAVQSTLLTYTTTTNSPTQYRIIPDGTFTPGVGWTALPTVPGPITVPIIAGASAASHTGTLQVRNANLCESVATLNFTVVINAIPAPAAIGGPTTVCVGGTNTLTNSLGGGTWTSGNTAVATIVAGTGVYTGVSAGTSLITYTVTTAGCTASVTQLVTVVSGTGSAITTQPSTVPQSWCLGDGGGLGFPITITVPYTPSGAYTFTWFKNLLPYNTGGASVGAGTQSTVGLVVTAQYIPPTTTAGTLYYYCVVQNWAGCLSTSSVSGEVTVNNYPTISATPSPASQILCLNIAPTALSVTGSAPSGVILKYEWYSNTVNSTTGGTLVATHMTASTSDSYTPPTGLTGTMYYYCVITTNNLCATKTTGTASVVVNQLPSFTGQPSTTARTYCQALGTPTVLNLSVTASAGAGTIIGYKWYSNTTASNSGGTLVATHPTASTTDTYLPVVTATGTLYYYCVVENSNSCTATSNVSGAISVWGSPAISVQTTANQVVCQNSTPTNLSVTAAAVGDVVTYQWYGNSVQAITGGTSMGSANGAQTATFTPPTAVVGTVWYYCVVTGFCSTATTSVTTGIGNDGRVEIKALPSFATNPFPTFTYCLSGTPTPITILLGAGSGTTFSYQWYSNTTNSNTGGTSLGSANGAQTATYTPSTAAVGTLYYYCTVTNEFTCTATSPVWTTITVMPNSVAGTATSVWACVNTSGSATLTGYTGTIQWQQSSDGSTGWGTVSGGSGGTTATYTTPVGTAMYYRAVVTSSPCSSSISNVVFVGVNVLPTFLAPPTIPSYAICQFSPATPLNVNAAAGVGTIASYQWFSNPVIGFPGSTLIAGANLATYTPANNVVGTLYYYCVVTNSVGCSNTSGLLGTVTVNTLPSFTTDPSATPQAVCVGGTPASLTVAATAGSGSITGYQWFSNTTSSNTGGTLLAGETGTTYAPLGTTAGVLYFYCVVTNTNGCSKASNVSGSVTVNALPAISTQSTGAQTLCVGATAAAFSVTATGAGLTYQWYSNTTASNTGGTSIGGATSSSYTPLTTAAGTKYYYCVVSGTCPPAVTSAVSGAVLINALPAISSQSTATQTLCAGATAAAFSVTATGAGLTYQWYSNATSSNTGGTLIGGAISASFTPPTTTAGTTYYYCVVSGTCSPVATSAVSGAVVINALPAITVQTTTTQTLCAGATAPTLTLTATGTALSYQWYSNTSASTTGGTAVGTNSVTYVPSTAVAGTLYYYCVVSGTCSPSVTSIVLGVITVNALPAISTQPSTTPQTICLGGAATAFSVTATGAGLTYQWYMNTTASNTGGTAVGTNSASYLPLTSVAGTTYYYCVVSGTCSPAATSAVSGAVTINALPAITSQSTATQSVCLGSPAAAFSVSATGAGLTYQWYSNTTASNTGGTVVGGATAASFTPSTAVAGTMYYYCVVGGTCPPAVTSAVSGAVITIVLPTFPAPPAITPVPVCLGGTTASLSVNAGAGVGTIFGYQWYSNVVSSTTGGTLIVGATFPTYTPLTTTSGTLYYYCVVTNSLSCSAASSILGAVTVNSLPSFAVQPSTAAAFYGMNATATALSVTANAGSGTILGYQWFSNTTSSNAAGTLITGATSASYTPSTANSGTLYYYCVVTNSNGCSFTSNVSGAITVNIVVNAKIMLEGPLSGSTMNTLLTVPTTQPYSGTFIAPTSVTTVPSGLGIVDWVVVELREAASALAADGTTIIAKRAAFVNNLGYVVDVDGTSPVRFNGVARDGSKSLFVVIRHRNHLAIMTYGGVTLTAGVYNWDFTTGTNKFFGGTTGYKVISGINVMVAGDADRDGQVAPSDWNVWVTSYGLSGYLAADMNMDGTVTVLDWNKWAANYGISIGLTIKSRAGLKYYSGVPK